MNATISTALTAIDFAFTAIEVTRKVTKTAWAIAKPILILTVALTVVAAYYTYEAGQAFRSYCDRLVESSLPTTPSMALPPATIAGYLPPARERVLVAPAILPPSDRILVTPHVPYSQVQMPKTAIPMPSYAELKAQAKQLGIKNYSRMKRTDLHKAVMLWYANNDR